MDIRIKGFAWEPEQPLGVPELCKHLLKVTGHKVSIDRRERIVHWRSQGKKTKKQDTRRLLGLVITLNDQEMFCRMDKSRIKAEKIQDALDFNFVAVHPETGRGLITDYRGAMGISAFCGMITRCYGDLKKQAINDAGSLGKTSTERTSLRKTKRKELGDMKWSYLTSNKGFTKLLNDMQKVNSVSYAISTPDAREDSLQMTPLGEHISMQREVITFAKPSTGWRTLVRSLGNILPGFLSGKSITKATVQGVDKNGLSRSIHLERNLEVYDSKEFNAAVEGMNLEPASFHESDLCTWLLEVFEDNDHLLQ